MAVLTVARAVFGLALIGFAAAPPAGASAPPPIAGPTTAPTEFAADDPARTWFAQLESTDAGERDSAREKLMGLSRDRLPQLKILVARSKPLLAAQVSALHDIVVQVYLSGDSYPTEPGGFLGIRWPEMYFSDDEPVRLGVPVGTRLPGFPCYRLLRDGDMIAGVLLEPDLPIGRLPNLRTPTQAMLRNAVSDAGAGRKIALEVFRSGEFVRVPIELAPRPMRAAVESLLPEREARAERYWQSEFVALLTSLS